MYVYFILEFYKAIFLLLNNIAKYYLLSSILLLSLSTIMNVYNLVIIYLRKKTILMKCILNINRLTYNFQLIGIWQLKKSNFLPLAILFEYKAKCPLLMQCWKVGWIIVLFQVPYQYFLEFNWFYYGYKMTIILYDNEYVLLNIVKIISLLFIHFIP